MMTKKRIKEKKARTGPQWIKLLGSFIICFGAAALGSFFTFESISTWYSTINKPWFNPPNWVFGPVWTLLYSLMAVSLYLVWKQGLKDKKVESAVATFLISLILNIVWSLLFFGLHAPALAFVEIILLAMSIAATINAFSKLSKNAGLLLYPYLLWVCFASILNAFVWQLNP